MLNILARRRFPTIGSRQVRAYGYEEKFVMATWTELHEITVLSYLVQETSIRTELGFTVVHPGFTFLVLVIGVKKKTNKLVIIYNSNLIQKPRFRSLSDTIGRHWRWLDTKLMFSLSNHFLSPYCKLRTEFFPVEARLGHKSTGKTRIRNLQYGPRKRG